MVHFLGKIHLYPKIQVSLTHLLSPACSPIQMDAKRLPILVSCLPRFSCYFLKCYHAKHMLEHSQFYSSARTSWPTTARRQISPDEKVIFTLSITGLSDKRKPRQRQGLSASRWACCLVSTPWRSPPHIFILRLDWYCASIHQHLDECHTGCEWNG